MRTPCSRTTCSSDCKSLQSSSWHNSNNNTLLFLTPGIFTTGGTKKIIIMDGLTVIPSQAGKPLTWDVTVISTLADSYVHLSSQSAGGAENRKMSKYADLPATNIFQPSAFLRPTASPTPRRLIFWIFWSFSRRIGRSPRNSDSLATHFHGKPYWYMMHIFWYHKLFIYIIKSIIDIGNSFYDINKKLVISVNIYWSQNI